MDTSMNSSFFMEFLRSIEIGFSGEIPPNGSCGNGLIIHIEFRRIYECTYFVDSPVYLKPFHLLSVKTSNIWPPMSYVTLILLMIIVAHSRHFNLEKAKTKYGKTVQNRRKMCEIKQAPIDLPLLARHSCACFLQQRTKLGHIFQRYNSLAPE